MKKTQSVETQAEEAADRKLRYIISQYGDANGERRKPYYREQLIREAKTAIAWMQAPFLLMDLETTNAPSPTKVTEALTVH